MWHVPCISIASINSHWPEDLIWKICLDMNAFSKAGDWDFDLDRHLNRIVPPSSLHRLPVPVSRFLGYRVETRQDVGNILGAVWSFVGAFCGLAVIAAVFNNTASIQQHTPPALIASFVSILPPSVVEYEC